MSLSDWLLVIQPSGGETGPAILVCDVRRGGRHFGAERVVLDGLRRPAGEPLSSVRFPSPLLAGNMSDKYIGDSHLEETGEEKQDSQEKEAVTPEKAEEQKLKSKYPNLGQKPGGSDFLMKRLQKGQKYFDSGDYNMAKAKMKNKQLPCAGPDKNLVTGDHIPTPQDLPQRKSSLVTSKLAGHVEDLHHV